VGGLATGDRVKNVKLVKGMGHTRVNLINK